MIALTVVPSEARAFLTKQDDERVLEFNIEGNAKVYALAAELVGSLGTCPVRINDGEYVTPDEGVAEDLGNLGDFAAAKIRATAEDASV